MRTLLESFEKLFDSDTFARLLEVYGWNRRTARDTHSIWYLEDKQTQAVLPASTDLLDFSLVFGQLIEQLCKLYGRTVEEIYSEYTGIRRNRVKLRIVGEELEGGVIPFAQALRLMESTKEMLVASYLATNSKKKNYLGSRPENIADHLEKIEMGQTEIGSYIINVFMPVEPTTENLVPEPPLATKAFRQLEEAAEYLKLEIETFKTTNQIEGFDKLVERGVSSNFCFAINEIGNDGKNDVEMQLEYYSRLDEEQIVKNISFDKSEINIIKKVGEYFKQDLTEPGYKLTGFVVDLHRDKDEVEGDVTVLATISGKRRHVRTHLTYLDYQTALEAHRNSAQVDITGTLVNHVNRTSMINVTDVGIQQSGSNESEELF